MITIAFNSSALNTAMATIEKQLRFAAAQALTRTAKEAQAEVIRELPERFILRTGWLAKGIRIVPATRDRLESTVLVKDDFMTQQETGGDKTSPFGDSRRADCRWRTSQKNLRDQTKPVSQGAAGKDWLLHRPHRPWFKYPCGLETHG